MEGTACPFFFAARSYSWRSTVISLVEYPLLDWRGRFNYLAAKEERKQLELYVMDLLWLDVKRHYETPLPQPSDGYTKKRTVDNRSAEEIIDDTINGIGR